MLARVGHLGGADASRKESLEPNDAGWYDEEADVLVIVIGAKKAAAQKALSAIVTSP